MRAFIQRVARASVTVQEAVVGSIGPGLFVLLGISHSDSNAEVELLVEKIVHLRIFSDTDGKFNLSLLDTGGAVLLVSQFTLYADMRKGRRPSFVSAAAPEHAAPLIDAFATTLCAKGVAVERGIFGADMQVSLVNDGPVTILLDSETFGVPRRAA